MSRSVKILLAITAVCIAVYICVFLVRSAPVSFWDGFRYFSDQTQDSEINRMDLNDATQQHLEQVPGIGPVLAQRILDYRNSHGSITSSAELTSIEGISAALADQICIHFHVGG